MILTIALLLIAIALIGTIILWFWLHYDQLKTNTAIAELKAMIASMRHDLAIDRDNYDQSIDGVRNAIVDSSQSQFEHISQVQEQVVREGKKTRKGLDKVYSGIIEEAILAATGSFPQDEIDEVKRLVRDEGKKTRKETQELKAGNEWAKKREHEITKRLDEIEKQLQPEVWSKWEMGDDKVFVSTASINDTEIVDKRKTKKQPKRKK